MGNYSVVVLDFETTGLSPDYGDRAIEIGAVLIRDNRLVDRFQSLMNPGEENQQLHRELYRHHQQDASALLPQLPMLCRNLLPFMEQHHLVAHNASFDRRFLDAELRRIDTQRRQEFACSMLISRRVYPEAPGHNLEALVPSHKRLKTDRHPPSCTRRCRDDRPSLDRNGQGSQVYLSVAARSVRFDATIVKSGEGCCARPLEAVGC